MTRNRLSQHNQHRLFGCLAVLHSAAMVALFLLRPWPATPQWFDRFWVGIGTLWFFWPIVLSLHVGRSRWRAILPLLVALFIGVLWIPRYSFDGAMAFGLPWGCTLSPISLTRFFVSYVRGRADARRDIRNGRLALEVYGFGAGGVAKPLRERYQIDTHVVAGCVVDDNILGHARGYNIVSATEIKRRLGIDIIRSDTGEPDFELIFDEQGEPK